MRVEAECADCGGTGLYVGFAEAPGSASVCSNCDGTGRDVISYKPWSGKRKGRQGVKVVKQPWGRGTSVTYAEFQRGKLPRD
jgi:hypothetical protein